MKKARPVLAVFLILAMLSAFTGACSSNTGESQYQESNSALRSGEFSSPSFVASYDDAMQAEESIDEYGLKIVYTTDMVIETLDFEKSYSNIMSALKESGGYVSSSDQSGGSNADGSYTRITANYTLRIPVNSYQKYLENADEFGNTTRRSDWTEDITTRYIDTEKKIESLKVQENRLMELVDEAKNLDDLLRIEQELSSVRHQIESNTATLQTYANQSDYATVTLRVSEVSALNSVQSKSFFLRVWEAVRRSAAEFAAILQDLVIAVIYIIPYAAVAFIAWRIVRPIFKKRKKKTQQKDIDPTPEA